MAFGEVNGLRIEIPLPSLAGFCFATGQPKPRPRTGIFPTEANALSRDMHNHASRHTLMEGRTLRVPKLFQERRNQ